MGNYNDLSELLESDSGAMAFYNSLPISLQQKMYRCGVATFEELYRCSAVGRKPRGERECMLSAVSASECTGLISQGGYDGMTEDTWLDYRSIEPFGLPNIYGE